MPHAVEGTRWRASMAGNCLKQIAFYMTGTPRTNDLTAPDYYRMQLGTDMHTRIETALAERNPTWEFEKKIDLRPIGIDGSGTSDIWDPDTRTVIEIKTINGFGFKKLAAWNNATGPRTSHILQAGLYGTALGAERIVLMYLNQELISPGEASKNGLADVERFITTFEIPMADIVDMLNQEMARLQFVQQTLDDPDGGLNAVPRYEPEMPVGARITDPMPSSGKAVWVKTDGSLVTQTGNTWRCDYCAWQAACALSTVEEDASQQAF